LRAKVEIAIPVIKSYNASDVIIERTRDFIFSDFSIMILIQMLVLFMFLGADKSINAALNFLPSKYVETLLSVICEIDVTLRKFFS
jgi:predicted PurR-regulated permease PerM